MHSHSKDAVAETLAKAHFQVDPAIEKIFRVNAPGRETDNSEPIKLLEVNRDTTLQGIVPIPFGPHAASGIYFPSVIIEIRPEEYDRVVAGDLTLPDDWVLGSEIARPEATATGSGRRE